MFSIKLNGSLYFGGYGSVGGVVLSVIDVVNFGVLFVSIGNIL